MNVYHAREFGKQNIKVVFLLAGWKNKMRELWLFSKILENNGFYCITYVYDQSVLSPNSRKTVYDLTGISRDVLLKIKILKAGGYTDFSVFGTSLGSLIALMVANQTPEIKKIILNTSGSSIADSVWSWDKVRPEFKNNLLNQGYSLEKLQIEWHSIAPINNINNLKGKKILVYLSRKDRIIPYRLGEELVNELKKQNYDYIALTNNYFGHVLTGLYNLLNAKTYLDFLSD